jgi:hypothetical protein
VSGCVTSCSVADGFGEGRSSLAFSMIVARNQVPSVSPWLIVESMLRVHSPR